MQEIIKALDEALAKIKTLDGEKDDKKREERINIYGCKQSKPTSKGTYGKIYL